MRARDHRDGVDLDGAELLEEAQWIAVAPPGESLRRNRQGACVRALTSRVTGGYSRRTLRGYRCRMEPSKDGSDEFAAGEIRAALESKRAELLQRIAEFGANDPAEPRTSTSASGSATARPTRSSA